MAQPNPQALRPVAGMHKLGFGHPKNGMRSILCLGAHSDDIEIGCGGTILRLAAEQHNLDFFWIVFSANSARRREALRSSRLFLENAKRSRVLVKNFRDSFFPYEGKPMKSFFASIAKRFRPDIIFTHHRHDLHQDHRLISDLTWNHFRDHFILEYEIPKYDGDLGTPNFFVELDEATCKKKSQYLLSAFRSQSGKRWFTDDTFKALLRLRGVESNSEGGYAEAFYSRKILA
jgi:LmbE family N-acetylglucosaminyl deacetylase